MADSSGTPPTVEKQALRSRWEELALEIWYRIPDKPIGADERADEFLGAVREMVMAIAALFHTRRVDPWQRDGRVVTPRELATRS